MAEKALEARQVRNCRYCKQLIGWVESPRTGKSYLCDVDGNTFDEIAETYQVDTRAFHKCANEEPRS